MTESSGTVTKFLMITIQGLTWLETKAKSLEYFILNSEKVFTHISTTGSMTNYNMELGIGNMGSWMHSVH